jgi:hypothetical protein
VFRASFTAESRASKPGVSNVDSIPFFINFMLQITLLNYLLCTSRTNINPRTAFLLVRIRIGLLQIYKSYIPQSIVCNSNKSFVVLSQRPRHRPRSRFDRNHSVGARIVARRRHGTLRALAETLKFGVAFSRPVAGHRARAGSSRLH